MARKQLIKGANAARVEERIARVPADLDAAPTVFSLIKAMEAEDGTGRGDPRPQRPPRAGPSAATAGRGKAEAGGAAAPRPRLGPSDFSAAEREAIVRCCTDYRNRLPIYLLSARKEVEVIDSVIAKCGRAAKGRR